MTSTTPSFLAILLGLYSGLLFLPAQILHADPRNRNTIANPADLVIYEVFPRNHGRQGNLREIADDLPRIRQTGANVVWLMPIHPIGTTHRKGTLGSPYSISDYFAIDPALGTHIDLQHLARRCDALHMRLIMDFVPNHCSWDHPYITNRPDWVVRDAKGQPMAPNRHWTDVVQLNHDHPELRREFEAILAFWIDQGVDGFRVDVAGNVPAECWQEVLPNVRAQFPGILLLAESTGPQFYEQGFDLTYDEPLRNTLLAVCQGRKPAAGLAHLLEETQTSYPPGANLLRFTENHDLPRTAQAFPAPLNRTAAVLIFCLPGVPLVYAGQECGISARPDLFEKDPILWENEVEGVRDFYQSLARARKEHPALRRGTLRFLETSHPGEVLAFISRHGSEAAVVILNFSKTELPGFAIHDEEATGLLNRQATPVLASGVDFPTLGKLDPGAWLVLCVKE